MTQQKTQAIFFGGATLPTIEYSETGQADAEFVVRDPRDGMFRILKLVNAPGQAFNWSNVPKNNTAVKILALTQGNAIVWRDPFADLSATRVEQAASFHGFVAVNRTTGNIVQIMPFNTINTWTRRQNFSDGANFFGLITAVAGASLWSPVVLFNTLQRQSSKRFLVMDVASRITYADLSAKKGVQFNDGVFEAVVNRGLRHSAGDWIEVDVNYQFAWMARHTFNAGLRIEQSQNILFGVDTELRRMGIGVVGSTTTAIQAEAVGIGITPTDDKANLHIRSKATPQVVIEYENARTRTSMQVGQGGNMQLDVAGEFIINPAGRTIRPRHPYHTNIGAPNAKFLALYVAEAWFDTIVAQDVVSTIGGTIITAPSNSLVYTVPA